MLYPNGLRVLTSIGRPISGLLVASGSLQYGGLKGARLNRFVSNTYNKATGGMPSGYGVKSIIMPIVSGAVSGRVGILLTPAATGVLGLPGTGSASLTISFAPVTGSLIASGNGSASFSIDVLPALLTASISGVGSTSFSITTNTPLMGAEASGNGSASISFAGTLLPYAIGSMSGSTVDSSVLTVGAISASVWEYVNRTLTSGGSGGPTAAEIAADLIAALQATTIPVNMTQVRGQAISGSGSESDPWGP